MRNLEDLSAFTAKTKKWKPDFCKCRICKQCVSGVGFI